MKSVVDLTFEISRHDPPTMRLITRRPIDGDRVAMTGKLAETGHSVRIVVEFRAGTYRVVGVSVDAPEGGEITSALLGIAVKEAANEALASAWSMFSATSEDMKPADADAARGTYRTDFMAKQRRRHLDDPFIRRVAEVYQAAEQSGERPLIGAIEREFVVSTAQAERYVSEARKRGFLPQSKRSKAK
jgi:hypothetical protein